MKITSKQLRQIIKEELGRLTEQTVGGGAKYAVAVGVDAQIASAMEILAGSGAGEKIRAVENKLDSIPMNTPFTARDLLLDPAALTPQLQDRLIAIDMEKVGVVDGTTIISFGDGDDMEALNMLVTALFQFGIGNSDEDVHRGDRVTSGIFRPGDFDESER
jgi:hypothetical protein